MCLSSVWVDNDELHNGQLNTFSVFKRLPDDIDEWLITAQVDQAQETGSEKITVNQQQQLRLSSAPLDIPLASSTHTAIYKQNLSHRIAPRRLPPNIDAVESNSGQDQRVVYIRISVAHDRLLSAASPLKSTTATAEHRSPTRTESDLITKRKRMENEWKEMKWRKNSWSTARSVRACRVWLHTDIWLCVCIAKHSKFYRNSQFFVQQK